MQESQREIGIVLPTIWLQTAFITAWLYASNDFRIATFFPLQSRFSSMRGRHSPQHLECFAPDLSFCTDRHVG
jgi:hypothetical protein